MMRPAGGFVPVYRVAVVCCCFLGLWLGAGNAAAQKPIPTGPDVYTQRKFREDAAKACERHQIRLYRKHTKDPQEVQAEAIEFLRAIYSQRLPVFTRDWNLVFAVGKEAMGKKVLDHGSHDPLVETCVCWMMYLSRWLPTEGNPPARLEDVDKLLNSAMRHFKECGYPDSAAVLTVALLLATAEAAHDGDGVARYRPLGAKTALALLGDQTIPAGDQRLVAWEAQGLIGHLNWADRKEFVNACAKQPGADPWTVDLLTGRYYLDLAWHYRGSGWANTVTPEAGKRFEENLRIAATHFVRAWEKQPKFPEPAWHMMDVAMAGDSDLSPREWFDRAVAAQVDFVPAYMSLLLALQPRWGGSVEEIRSLARECLAAKRFDTYVPLMYFNAMARVGEELGEKDDIWKEPEAYAGAKECLEGILREPSMADGKELEEPHSRQMSRYVAVALHAGQYGDSRKMLDKVGDRIHLDILRRYGLKAPYDLARIRALTGGVAENVKAAEKLLGGEKQLSLETAKRALATLETAAKKNADEKARPYFDFHIASLKMREDFEKGGWVNFTFDKDLTDWRSTGGEWDFRGERRMLAHCLSANAQLALIRKTALPPPFEVEVEMSWDEEAAPRFYSGLLVGKYMTGFNTAGKGRLFGFHPAGQTYIVSSADGQSHGVRLRPASNPVKLAVKVWDRRYAFSINGEPKATRARTTILIRAMKSGSARDGSLEGRETSSIPISESASSRKNPRKRRPSSNMGAHVMSVANRFAVGALAVLPLTMAGRSFAAEPADAEPGATRPPNRMLCIKTQGKDDLFVDVPRHWDVGSPSISPDGRRIAFDALTVARPPVRETWLVRVDGKSLHKVADGAAPRWSPDSRRLLISGNEPAGENGVVGLDTAIFEHQLVGGEERKICEGRLGDWSPDGRRIALARGGTPTAMGGTRVAAKIFIGKADGSEMQEFSDGDWPSWSPDGKKIACCVHEKMRQPVLWIVEVESKKRSKLGNGFYRAQWAGDGKSVVCNACCSLTNTTNLIVATRPGSGSTSRGSRSSFATNSTIPGRPAFPGTAGRSCWSWTAGNGGNRLPSRPPDWRSNVPLARRGVQRHCLTTPSVAE